MDNEEEFFKELERAIEENEEVEPFNPLFGEMISFFEQEGNCDCEIFKNSEDGIFFICTEENGNENQYFLFKNPIDKTISIINIKKGSVEITFDDVEHVKEIIR